MNLKERLRRLERIFTEGALPPTAIVFGLGRVEDWDAGAQRYREEQGVGFEPHVCFGGAGRYLSLASDLPQLRQAAVRNRFRLVVLAAEHSPEGLWAEDRQDYGTEVAGDELEGAYSPA